MAGEMSASLKNDEDAAPQQISQLLQAGKTQGKGDMPMTSCMIVCGRRRLDDTDGLDSTVLPCFRVPAKSLRSSKAELHGPFIDGAWLMAHHQGEPEKDGQLLALSSQMGKVRAGRSKGMAIKAKSVTARLKLYTVCSMQPIRAPPTDHQFAQCVKNHLN